MQLPQFAESWYVKIDCPTIQPTVFITNIIKGYHDSDPVGLVGFMQFLRILDPTLFLES